MAWAAVAGATIATVGGAVLGRKGQQSQSSNEPWGPQQPYLTHGFEKAQDAFDKAYTTGAYTGQRVAGLNPYQTSGYTGIGQFAGNQGVNTANSILGAAQNNLGQAQYFGPNAGALFSKAMTDPTGAIVANAGQYANNPYLNGQIDAASRDVVRNLHEEVLPGLDQGAAATGNMNSSRTGVAQGIAQRGAADRIGDIASTMRGSAYANGLNMAQNQYNQSFSNALNANNQNFSAANFGVNAANSGLNAGYGAYDAMVRGGTGLNAYDQKVLDAQKASFEDSRDYPLNLVGRYMGALNGSFGGAQSGTSGGGAGGAIQGGLTGMMGGLGLYNRFVNQGYNGWSNYNQPVMQSQGVTAGDLQGMF